MGGDDEGWPGVDSPRVRTPQSILGLSALTLVKPLPTPAPPFTPHPPPSPPSVPPPPPSARMSAAGHDDDPMLPSAPSPINPISDNSDNSSDDDMQVDSDVDVQKSPDIDADGEDDIEEDLDTPAQVSRAGSSTSAYASNRVVSGLPLFVVEQCIDRPHGCSGER